MTDQTLTGYISDSISGATQHRKSAANNTKMSVRESTLAGVDDGADYVFVSKGKVYRIVNQDFASLRDCAGQTVTLTGVFTEDSVTVSNIAMSFAEGTMVAVFGIFYDKEQADRSVERLTASDFSKDDVSMLAPDILGSKDLAHDRHSKAGNSTAVVTSSVAVGGTLGLVAGIGALAIPGVGPLLAAGPMLGALAGMGAGGIVGGAIDAIDAAGPPDPGAKRYEGHIEEGGILVTIHCYTADEVARAKEVLNQTGARAISSSDDSSEDFL